MNKLSLLKHTPYFNGLDEEGLAELIKRGKLIKISCGHPLIQKGEESTEAYILLEGRLRALAESEDGQETILGEIGKGEVVGEMAAILGTKRNATIIAVRNSTLFRLSSEDFIHLLQKQKGTLLELSKTIIKRSQSSFTPSNQVSTCAIVPISPDIDLDLFSQSLEQSISKYACTSLLSSEIIQKKHQSINLKDRNEALDALLNEYEEENPIVVYQTDKGWSNWTATCLTRADKILWVADATKSSEITSFEHRIMEASLSINHASHELVLLHPTYKTFPKNTKNWLEKRKFSRHYHVAKDRPDHIRRLARFLTGNAIGVALSSGGARSGVQFGVLHALLEGGIPIDIVGGSSGGAIASGVFAQLTELNEFKELALETARRIGKSRRLTLPLVALYAGGKFTQAIQAMARGRDIEDLWVDFFTVSLSLVSGELKIHTKGPLWEAMRASTAVNGIMPPLIKDGDCLVDGGLVNSCPTDLLSKLGSGKNIAIIASTKSGITLDQTFSPNVSGWNILLKKLNPFNRKKIHPGIGANILQSMYIASDHLKYRIFDESNIDLFIHPEIPESKMIDISSGPKLYEFGYEYGLKHIDEWRQQLNISL